MSRVTRAAIASSASIDLKITSFHFISLHFAVLLDHRRLRSQKVFQGLQSSFLRTTQHRAKSATCLCLGLDQEPSEAIVAAQERKSRGGLHSFQVMSNFKSFLSWPARPPHLWPIGAELSQASARGLYDILESKNKVSLDSITCSTRGMRSSQKLVSSLPFTSQSVSQSCIESPSNSATRRRHSLVCSSRSACLKHVSILGFSSAWMNASNWH